jgi:hypothetical protein
MDWSEFFDYYFQLWIISIPLTIYLFFSLCKWIIHFLDYLIHYGRIRYISREIKKLEIGKEKDRAVMNDNKIVKAFSNLKMLEAILNDANKSALGQDIFNNIRKIIR